MYSAQETGYQPSGPENLTDSLKDQLRNLADPLNKKKILASNQSDSMFLTNIGEIASMTNEMMYSGKYTQEKIAKLNILLGQVGMEDKRISL